MAQKCFKDESAPYTHAGVVEAPAEVLVAFLPVGAGRVALLRSADNGDGWWVSARDVVLSHIHQMPPKECAARRSCLASGSKAAFLSPLSLTEARKKLPAGRAASTEELDALKRAGAVTFQARKLQLHLLLHLVTLLRRRAATFITVPSETEVRECLLRFWSAHGGVEEETEAAEVGAESEEVPPPLPWSDAFMDSFVRRARIY